MMSFSFWRLMNNPLVNEKTSFEFEHFCANVANESEVVVNVAQVRREFVAGLEGNVALPARVFVHHPVQVTVKHSGRPLVRVHQHFVNLN
jgi:hypothetical protein